jgi:hypothetical protein
VEEELAVSPRSRSELQTPGNKKTVYLLKKYTGKTGAKDLKLDGE